MRRSVVRILVAVIAVFVLYLILRAASPSRAAGSEPDTMRFAARLGLKCNDPLPGHRRIALSAAAASPDSAR